MVAYLQLFILALLVRIACFTGIVGSDDICYSYFSQFIAQGLIGPEASHLGLRVGLTFPVGLSYWLFGIGEWTTILVPLLASALSVPVLVAIGNKLFPMPAALLAGLLLMTFPTHVAWATILVPEPLMELCVLIGVLVYLEAREAGEKWVPRMLVGVCFGLAYLVKEAGLFVGIAFILFSIFDQKWKLAFGIAVGMASVGLLEVAYYFSQTGDLLFRAHVIARSQELYAAAVGGNVPTTWRLFKAYPYMMLVPSKDFGLHSLLALMLAGAYMIFVRSAIVWMLVTWAAVPMLYLNFGSSSLADYQPVFISERYIGLVFPPLFLLAGAALYSCFSVAGWKRYLVGGIVTVVAAAGLAGSFVLGESINFTAEIRALDSILKRAQAQHRQIVRFEGAHAERWRLAMGLLSGRNLTVTECATDCLVIGPDSLGLPVATVVPGARAERPLGPLPVYTGTFVSLQSREE